LASGAAFGEASRVKAIDLLSLQHLTAPETTFSRPISFAGSIFTPGGLLGCFDGETYGSPLFFTIPRITDTAQLSGGNLTASATYIYKALYSYVDHNGRKWRSAPSLIATEQTTGTNKSIRVKVETARLFDRGKTDGVSGYQIELYRSLPDETDAFFLIGAFQNDPTANEITVVDNCADDDVGEELYTDGNPGGLESQLTPAVSHVIQFQNRLFLTEAGTGTEWYSTDLDLNHGLIFNEALTLDVGDAGDPTTGKAVASDSNLIVFKKSLVYIVGGQGLNPIGQGSNYDFRIIASGIGCSNPQSIVTGPDGYVYFKSNSKRAGIHRTNGGPPEYVGQGVRAFDNLTITGAVVVADVSQIRFYTREGTTLCFNWVTQSWTTNTSQGAFSVTTGYAGTNGAAYVSASSFGTFIDGVRGADLTEGPYTYTLKLRSPWLAVAGIEGWERIKKIQGVGKVGDAHTVRATLYGNYDTATPIGVLTKSFAFDARKWEWEIKPRVQKLKALMIELEITPDLTFPLDYTGAEYLGADEFGNGIVNIPNYMFSDSMVDGSLTLTNTIDNAADGTFTIAAVNSDTQIVVFPAPGIEPGPLFGTARYPKRSMVLAYTLQTDGPTIVGVALDVMVKRGLNKQATSTRMASTA
jgi:hypothetical protein